MQIVSYPRLLSTLHFITIYITVFIHRYIDRYRHRFYIYIYDFASGAVLKLYPLPSQVRSVFRWQKYKEPLQRESFRNDFLSVALFPDTQPEIVPKLTQSEDALLSSRKPCLLYKAHLSQTHQILSPLLWSQAKPLLKSWKMPSLSNQLLQSNVI